MERLPRDTDLRRLGQFRAARTDRQKQSAELSLRDHDQPPAGAASSTKARTGRCSPTPSSAAPSWPSRGLRPISCSTNRSFICSSRATRPASRSSPTRSRDLIAQLDIDGKAQAIRTVHDYNAAAHHAADGFDPTQKDGLSTSGLDLEKTNWAIKLEKPPFYAYSATGGITFTFGGLKVDENARVMGTDWRPIPGLLACGEMIGGLFYDNYPAGTGLVSGATFGRIAGRTAVRGTAGNRATTAEQVPA